ncbi:tumor necrosis factor receptor superfamily member 3 isoform X1 [Anguilla anguilla]|uniref:tumor necrosis factor receptor superfamily member 3 isoform X1 n=1 Tax=Anguilla anguilla TaxID=7936 RepID=UPI0015B08952|nr:tumor necrosis factor receptor superfamily member 3 isoform X1 [Anguilla anguilla]
MEWYRCVLASLTLLGLFVPVCSASLSSCPSPPSCGQGFGLKNCVCVRCLQDHYWVVKSGLTLCARCTEKCSGYLKEIIPCGPTQNRVCHCDRGFFCESKAQFSCRRCKPCPAQTFSSEISMEESCRPYTDCAGRGLAVNVSGTPTQDQRCADPILYLSPHINPTVGNAETTQFSTSEQTIPLPVTTDKPQNTSLTMPRTTAAPSSVNGRFEESSSSVVLVAVLLAAAMLLVCCVWHKKHVLKRKGWPFLKHLQEQGRKEDTEGGYFSDMSQGLLGSETGRAQPVGPPKQQVAMDHSGSGDSVSNTVGSIYIYSPGMVVLGANTAEQREEEKPPGEASAHLGTPHQEQGPSELPETVCVQEEEGKGLSYPVPATGK